MSENIFIHKITLKVTNIDFDLKQFKTGNDVIRCVLLGHNLCL